MTKNIQIAPDKSHVFIAARGQSSLGEMKKIITKLIEIQDDSGIDKLLVDSRSGDRQRSASQIYDGAKVIADMLKGKYRIAILVNSVNKKHRFFEDVAVNHGAKLAFFQHEEAARAWLFDNKPLSDSQDNMKPGNEN